MTLSLCCPNCGREIGTMGSSDGYQKKFFYRNEDGVPVCPTCGTGDDTSHIKFFLWASAIIIIVSILVAIFGDK